MSMNLQMVYQSEDQHAEPLTFARKLSKGVADNATGRSDDDDVDLSPAVDQHHEPIPGHIVIHTEEEEPQCLVLS
jgi:hypothetical protein